MCASSNRRRSLKRHFHRACTRLHQSLPLHEHCTILYRHLLPSIALSTLPHRLTQARLHRYTIRHLLPIEASTEVEQGVSCLLDVYLNILISFLVQVRLMGKFSHDWPKVRLTTMTTERLDIRLGTCLKTCTNIVCCNLLKLISEIIGERASFL